MQQDVNINDHITITNPNVPLVDTSIESPITYEEVKQSILRAKLGKPVSCDVLSTEALDNDITYKFLFKLLQNCFETGVMPSLWLKGIITPLPKDNTLDPRDPMNYRGINLVCSMYKLYCYILNARLLTLSEVNGLIADAQNGF